MEASIADEDALARDYRLCRRWFHPFNESNVRRTELALQIIPPSLGHPSTLNIVATQAESRERFSGLGNLVGMKC